MMTIEEQQIHVKPEKTAKRPMHPVLKFFLKGTGKYLFGVALVVGFLMIEKEIGSEEIFGILFTLGLLNMGARFFGMTFFQFVFTIAIVLTGVFIYRYIL